MIDPMLSAHHSVPARPRWKELLVGMYQALFCRPIFYPLNRRLFLMSLRGIGVLNSGPAVAESERRLVGKILKLDPRSLIMDVGAHIGEYSTLILQAFPEAQLHAFEPHPDSFKKLELLRSGHQNFRAVNAALGATNGKVSFYDYENSGGSAHASLYQAVIEDVHHGMAKEIEVERQTIDEYCSTHSLETISLLKIDTEGSELDVLHGARHMLASGAIIVIQFEFNEMNIISRTFLRDFQELLKDYSLFRSLPGGFVPFDYLSVFEIFGYQNFVAVRKGHEVLLD